MKIVFTYSVCLIEDTEKRKKNISINTVKKNDKICFSPCEKVRFAIGE
jgi:hypothetical protein